MEDGPELRIGTQEVVGGIFRYPQHVCGALAVAFLEKSERWIFSAELRMVAG